MVRSIAAGLLFLAVAGAAAAVWLRPSSDATAQQPPTCGSLSPFNFNTLEIPSSNTDFEAYKTLINLAVEGKLFPETLSTVAGTVDFRYQGVTPGNRAARTPSDDPEAPEIEPDPAYRIPPSIYYAVAWIEATWANAASSVPWGGVGPALRSFDCGFGLGQVTTGMANNTGTPSAKQALIGVHPAFNLAEGVRILADKWNSAPRFRPIAGEGDPAMLEDWYYALWSYNGFAFINHPFHPNRDPLRAGNASSPIYHCWDETAPSFARKDGGTGAVYGHGDYTYPELVYGCMRHPPQRGGLRVWESVELHMPDFSRPEIAAAFDVENFTGCVSSGCPGMDFPTSFPDEEIFAHEDIVEETDPAVAARYLGSPSLQFSGPSTATLEATSAGDIQSVAVSATNVGTFIAPFRIRSTEPWLVVTDVGRSQTRYLNASLAVGSDVEVVVTTVPERVTKQGHVAEMRVTLNPFVMPPGPVTATVFFEPLFGGGEVFSVTVTGTNNYVPPTPTPIPTPTPVPSNEELPYRAVAPALSVQQ
jgi:hypothetical protein